MAKKSQREGEPLWPNPKARKKFDPKTMKLPLPFGHLDRFVVSGGLWLLLTECQVLPDLNERLSKLRKHDQLALEVDAISRVAAAKNIGGVEYMDDWELRARLAEAELVGLHLDSSEFAVKVSKERSTYAKLGWSRYPDDKKLVQDRCERWIRDGMHEKRETMLDELKKELAYHRVSPKTIERWWDERKAELTGKGKKVGTGKNEVPTA